VANELRSSSTGNEPAPRAPFLLRKVRKSRRFAPIDRHLSSEKFNGLRPDANNLSSARTEQHHPFGAVYRKTGWSKAPLQPTGSSGGVDFKQLGAATAKDPSLVASLVCRLPGFQQFPSRHCRTYRTLLALRSRTLRYQSRSALRALAMYRKSRGRRDRLSIDLGTESMPELEPGTKRRASVMRTPWSAVLWAAPSRAGPRHSRTGLRLSIGVATPKHRQL